MIYLKMALEPLLFCMRAMVGRSSKPLQTALPRGESDAFPLGIIHKACLVFFISFLCSLSLASSRSSSIFGDERVGDSWGNHGDVQTSHCAADHGFSSSGQQRVSKGPGPRPVSVVLFRCKSNLQPSFEVRMGRWVHVAFSDAESCVCWAPAVLLRSAFYFLRQCNSLLVFEKRRNWESGTRRGARAMPCI